MPLFYSDLHLRALEAAYHRHYDQLCAVAAAVLGGEAALAQDAVQEAWLRLNAPGVRERIRTDDADRLRGLLLVTVRNAARNLRRAAPAARELTLPEEGWATLPDPAPGPAEQAEQADAVAALRRGLQKRGAAAEEQDHGPPAVSHSGQTQHHGEIRQNREGTGAALPPEEVDARIAGQPVEPGGEGALPLEFLQPPPGVEKGLLAQLQRVVRVARHAQGQVVDALLVGLHQGGEGVLVPGTGPLYQLLFLCHAFLTSRCDAPPHSRRNSVFPSCRARHP